MQFSLVAQSANNPRLRSERDGFDAQSTCAFLVNFSEKTLLRK